MNFFFALANCNFVSNIISVQKLTIGRLHLAIQKKFAFQDTNSELREIKSE